MIIIGGGYTVIKFFASNSKVQPLPIETTSPNVYELDPSVTVELTPRADKKAVNLSITNIPQDTSQIEYELSYLTGNELPKGAVGTIRVDSQSTIEREILLGTCSKNTCTYDEGVKSVTLVLRFSGLQGIAQFIREYSLD